MSDRVTTNCPSSFASAALASITEMATVAVSSSAMVTVAVLAPGVVSTLTSVSSEAVRVRMTVSLSSNSASSMTLMSIVAEFWPANTVTLPRIVAKSLPFPAVPVTV